ncbi:oligosaccharide flippase family protein [Arthrobacter crystallopoietes]|uniref:oligosaccharide flippase family protein n=1 Tax=Crystallibacter crystallopoietes TaxID=37928 RepID=UPI0011115CC7|nr:oligosaccharide flippase family protein [Arthrobacter crystallopoietes]
MNKSRTLASGAAWSYGLQIVTTLVQFGYAAITTRVVSAQGFGEYSVSLAVAGFVSILANGGLAQTVGRLDTLDSRKMRALGSYALLLGTASATFLWFSAGFWAVLWSMPGATLPVQVLSISALLAPSLGLSTGLLRRRSKFRAIALTTAFGNIVGMAIGVWAVNRWGNAASLVVSTVVAQIVILILAQVINGRTAFGFGRLGQARAEISFSWNVTISGVLGYFVGNLSKWSVAREVSAGALGNWNRADVVTTVPFQQLQNAMIQTVYPEFRHDIGNAQRAQRVWPDLLALIAWITIPASVVSAVFIPVFLPILFGEGWELAIELVPWLALAAGILPVTTTLASAVEAMGAFKWVWATQVALIGVQVLAVIAISRTHSIVPAIIALFATNAVRHAVHLIFCWRHRYLHVGRLIRNYMQVGLGGAVAWVWSVALVYLFTLDAEQPWRAAALAMFVILSLASLWSCRNRLPPIVIVRKYKLI